MKMFLGCLHVLHLFWIWIYPRVWLSVSLHSVLLMSITDVVYFVFLSMERQHRTAA